MLYIYIYSFSWVSCIDPKRKFVFIKLLEIGFLWINMKLKPETMIYPP